MFGNPGPKICPWICRVFWGVGIPAEIIWHNGIEACGGSLVCKLSTSHEPHRSWSNFCRCTMQKPRSTKIMWKNDFQKRSQFTKSRLKYGDAQFNCSNRTASEPHGVITAIECHKCNKLWGTTESTCEEIEDFGMYHMGDLELTWHDVRPPIRECFLWFDELHQFRCQQCSCLIWLQKDSQMTEAQ